MKLLQTYLALLIIMQCSTTKIACSEVPPTKITPRKIVHHERKPSLSQKVKTIEQQLNAAIGTITYLKTQRNEQLQHIASLEQRIEATIRYNCELEKQLLEQNGDVQNLRENVKHLGWKVTDANSNAQMLYGRIVNLNTIVSHIQDPQVAPLAPQEIALEIDLLKSPLFNRRNPAKAAISAQQH